LGGPIFENQTGRVLYEGLWKAGEQSSQTGMNEGGGGGTTHSLAIGYGGVGGEEK